MRKGEVEREVSLIRSKRMMKGEIYMGNEKE